METAEGDVPFRPRTGKAASAPLLPEVEAYLQLLLVIHLTNIKRYTEVRAKDAAIKLFTNTYRYLDLSASTDTSTTQHNVMNWKTVGLGIDSIPILKS